MGPTRSNTRTTGTQVTQPLLCISHLLLLSILSLLVLLPASSSRLPLPDLLWLLALVEALLVDAESHTGNKSKNHNHNSSYSPHGHWKKGREKTEGFQSIVFVAFF